MKQVSYRIKIFFLPLLLGLFLFAGCSLLPVEHLGTDSGDKRLEFETVYKGYVYYDEGNFFGAYIGYKYPENTFINSQEQLETFFQNSGISFESSDIDFEEYMLFVTRHDTVSDSEKIKPYDILEISCNEEILDVVIKNSDSGTIEPRRHKWPCFYNISKIRKSDFPYEPRDFLMHAVQ